MRRLASGLPCMLLAALLLLSRLIAPAIAMPADPVDLALATICHSDAPSEPGAPSQPDHSDCLLCPACDLASHAALPTPSAPAIPMSALALIGHGAAVPPATGPPSQSRATAQPTGPPRFSA